MKNFSFPVLNVFLKIISCRFRNAEILHGIWHFDTHFFTNPEEMINRVARCKNNGSVIKDINPVPAELFSSYTFKLYKGTEINIYVKLFCQIRIG